MNRCPRTLSTPPSGWRVALLSTALMLMANLAVAQEAMRAFPAAAKRAVLQVSYPPDILLNGKPARLSPGARIRGVNNLLMVSGALVGQQVVVNYVLDPLGLVHEVWVLNATEAQQTREGSVQPPNYVSDAATATGEVGGKSSAPASGTQQ